MLPGARRVFGLDLVRAVAILLVLVSHCGIVFTGWCGKTLPVGVAYGGLFGVEIFFVLSGYLVGRILLRTPSTPAGWRKFLTRRWIRTLPLYYLCLALLSWAWPPDFWRPDHRRVLLQTLPEYALFLQNFAWTVGHHNWFGASWSLAVEEWFYVSFSAVLLGLTARFGRKAAFVMAACLFLLGPALARGLAAPANAAPHSVVTAVDQICVGVVMAWVSLSAPARFSALSGWLPLGLALCLLFWWEQLWIPAPVRQALWLDVVAAGIALCLPAAAAWQRATGVPAAVIRAISLRSYGLYLIHLPLLELATYYRGRWPVPVWCQIVTTCAAMVTLPALTWKYIERPLLEAGAVRRAREAVLVG